MLPESPPPAPAVVAVVVTCDPGPWFEQVLTSLAAQDYPNLSVLVIDAGSSVDPTPTVAGVLPGAFVRLTGKRGGFGTAANEVLTMVSGASHYLFCHDDVALAPDAVRLLVEEAFRSNAGVASPKYVQWDSPDRLVAVGATTDKVGVLRSLVDRGELDQEQHDSVRDVLVAPSGTTLVRADLFEALGGFDAVVDHCGEDVNLSWRARLAGARLVVVPGARVRHLEATRTGRRLGRRARAQEHLEDVNRYRTVLACYRWYTLAWIVPLALFWALGEGATRLFQGQASEAWASVTAPARALQQPGQLLSARRKVQGSRQAGDGALRQLQVRGNTRLRAFLQSRVEEVRTTASHTSLASRLGSHTRDVDFSMPAGLGDEEAETAGRVAGEKEPVGRTPSQAGALIGLLIVIVLFVGSRGLLGRGLPQIGTLPTTSSGWSGFWRAWWTAWQPNGLGVGAPSTPALALLGLLSTVLFGAVGTAQHLAVLGPLLLGPFGAWWSARWWGSKRGQIAAAVMYAVVPLPYNALAGGRWDGVVVYAAMPWVLSLLARLSSLVPLPFVSIRRSLARLAGLGVLVAVVAAVAPSFLYVVLITGLALFGGSALAGRFAGSLRLLGMAAGAAAAGFVLLLPWSATVVASGTAVLGADQGPAGRLGLGAVLRFHTGPFGSGGWEWLLLVAAALPLFIGRGWRLEWAARLWVLALISFALAWGGRRGWLPAFPVEVALAPAAAALAGAAALGVAAFELDLPGYRFGWRQVAAAVAGFSLALASLPFLTASGSGRWKVPSSDASSVLAFLPDNHAGDYRVLWVGAPSALPLASWKLHPGIGYATSFDGEPSLSDDWAPGSAGAAPVLAGDLRLVENRLTTKLGHLLAPAGVRYLVVPTNTAPSGGGGVPVAIPIRLLSGLGLQTDLRTIEVGDQNYQVFENAAWAPVRAVLPAAAVSASRAGAGAVNHLLQSTSLQAAKPVLTGTGPAHASGTVPGGSDVYVGTTRSGGWHLAAGGTTVRARPAFGWAMSFQSGVGAGGAGAPTSGSSASGSSASGSVSGGAVSARLFYDPPFLVRGVQVLEILLWVVAIAYLIVDRRRRSRGEPEVADPAWFVPMAASAAVSPPRSRGGAGRGAVRPRRPGPTGAGSVPERSAGSVPERSAGSVPERSAGSVPERSAGSVPERSAGSVPERSAGSATPEQSVSPVEQAEEVGEDPPPLLRSGPQPARPDADSGPMSRHGTHISRTVRRAPVVAVVIGALVAGGLADRAHASKAPTQAQMAAAAAQVVEPVPIAAPANALSSSWFCAGASGGASGSISASGHIVIANTGARPANAVVTVVPNQGSSVRVPVRVGPYTSISVPETVPNGSAWVGAIVDVDAGAVAVAQTVEGLSTSVRPCATSGSSVWYFASGQTRINADTAIQLLNPYPSDSIVDLSFSTNQGIEEPQEFTGIDVPAGGLVTLDLGAHLRRRASIATTVKARTGRIVAWETEWVTAPPSGQAIVGTPQAANPLSDPALPVPGVDAILGAPAAAMAWSWPDGLAGSGLDEQYVIYNPGALPAQVRLSVGLQQGAAEPFDLSVGPYQAVPIGSELQARIPAGQPHSASLVSLNGVGVVATRTVTANNTTVGASAGQSRTGITSLPGGPMSAPDWIVPAPSTGPNLAAQIVVLNGSNRAVQLTVAQLKGSAPGAPAAATVGPEGRLAVPVPAGVSGPIEVRATGPVYVEYDLFGGNGTSGISASFGVPLS
jgi:GT2 family glycosyltransferase